MAENKPIPILVKNNRTYLSIKEDRGRVLPFSSIIFASSGHGKGLFSEAMIEEWKVTTGGLVFVISDPKMESEFSFVQYLPEARYHKERLKLDGKIPKTHKCKLYHPYTHSIPRGYLPPINFFTLSLKDMTREMWSILTESSFDSESIRLMMRVSEDLKRDDGLFTFLHNIQRLVSGKKRGRKTEPDPDNFYLRVGGGTSKSITETAGLLAPFKKNYFLRKDTCPYKLNWKEIMKDTESYHVFINMWLGDQKWQEFVVLALLQQIIENRHHTNKPILIVIPEIKVLCPRNPQGYRYFLSQAISESISRMRSMGRGMSIILDSQVYDNTSDQVKKTANVTFFGQLSPGDSETVCKAMQYKREIREQLQNMPANGYYKAGEETDGVFRTFFPCHMHKEPEYNWIEMYAKFFRKNMVRYDDLIKYFRKEFKDEETLIKNQVEKELRLEREEELAKKAEREEKKSPKKEVKEKAEDKTKLTLMKICYERVQAGEKFRPIGRDLNLHKDTVKKYAEKYADELAKRPKVESDDLGFGEYFGEGIMPEEIEDNFG